jgi:hypothetical protein
MSSRHLAARGDDERGRAEERLQAAVDDRTHIREVAEGSKDAVEASASLRAADDQVVARERWLRSVEDHDD